MSEGERESERAGEQVRQTTEPIHATREAERERERERLGSSFFALSRREHKAEVERDAAAAE